MDKAEHLEKHLDRQLQWVRAAESRLALVLPLATAMLGALAVSVPRADDWTAITAIAAAFALLFLLTSIAFAAVATFPRTTGPKGSLVYFGGIDSLEMQQYVDSVKSLSEEAYIDDLASQVHRNAQIATKKYSWVQRSMGCLFLSALPWAIALIRLYAQN